MTDRPTMECISLYEEQNNHSYSDPTNFPASSSATSCRATVDRHAFTTPFPPKPVMSGESSAASSFAADSSSSGNSSTGLPPQPALNTANLSLLSAAASQRAAALPQRPSALSTNSFTIAAAPAASSNSANVSASTSTTSANTGLSRVPGLKRPSSFLPTRPTPSSDLGTTESPLEKKIIEAKKRSLTLDFTSPESAKKTLQTPDVLRFLQLTSPELEKFLTQGVAVVTTPTPTQFLFPKNVTAQQEQYARGFIDALNQLHQVHGFVPPGNLLSPGFVVTPGVNKNSLIGDKAGTSSNGASVAGVPDVAASSAAVAAAALAVSSHLQSPTRPESSLASVIMQTVGFAPNSMTSQQLFSSAGTVAASMALLNQSLKFDQQKTHILAEFGAGVPDPAPSQSAAPGTMEFTNLTQAPNNCSATNTNSQPQPHNAVAAAEHAGMNNPPHLQHPSSAASLAAVAGIANSVIPSAIVPSSAATAAGLLMGGRLEAALQHHQIQQQQQNLQVGLDAHPSSSSAHFLDVGNPASNHHGSPSPRSLVGTNSPAPSSNNPSPYPHPHSRASSSAGLRPIDRIKQESSLPDSLFLGGGSSAASLDTDGYSGRSLASGSSTGSFIDMDSQDDRKLERKRARNRLAATKCRKRKMERIEELEGEVKKKKDEFTAVNNDLEKLRNEVNSLQEMIKKHNSHGCNLESVVTSSAR